MIKPSQKKLEVFLRGKMAQYLEKTLNMELRVKEFEELYQSLFEKINDEDLEVIR